MKDRLDPDSRVFGIFWKGEYMFVLFHKAQQEAEDAVQSVGKEIPDQGKQKK